MQTWKPLSVRTLANLTPLPRWISAQRKRLVDERA
jgi:hypothetical protein